MKRERWKEMGRSRQREGRRERGRKNDREKERERSEGTQWVYVVG